MEIKSNNVLIGAFTIATIVGIFLILLWVSGVQLNRQFAYYKIIFDGSVSGLSESGAVQYNGLPVGKVTDLYLMERNPNKVIAIIEVDTRTPIKVDSVAQLELSGLTGVAFIQLTGGSPESDDLLAAPGQDYPVIRAAPSTLQDLLKSGPEIGAGLAQLPQLVSETRALVTSLDRIATRAGDDPGRFLVGNNVPEVEAR